MSAAGDAAAALALERSDCPICACPDSAARPVLERPPYRVVRCATCGFAYLCPRPTASALHSLYASGAYYASEGTAGYSDYRAQERALRLTFARVMRSLARRGLLGGSLLEVGCGYGLLLDEARGGFERRDGTEMAPEAIAIARRRADTVHCGGLESVPSGERYDLILSSQVIEHVHDPVGFLEAQLAHLHPGGSIVVATPEMGSGWQRLLGARWPSFKIPEHLLYFDRRSLRTLLERVGLRDVRSLPWPHAFPLALVAQKLGFPLPERIGRVPIWIPGTTLAMVGRSAGLPIPG